MRSETSCREGKGEGLKTVVIPNECARLAVRSVSASGISFCNNTWLYLDGSSIGPRSAQNSPDAWFVPGTNTIAFSPVSSDTWMMARPVGSYMYRDVSIQSTY